MRTRRPSPGRTARSWLWPEVRRAVVATVLATVASALAVSIWIFFHPEDVGLALPLGTVVAWATLVGSHAILTAAAFSGLDGDTLDTALSVTGLRRSSAPLRPPWPAQVSIMAFIVVAGLVLVPAWREHSFLLICALIMVCATWADMVVSSAVHYAAIDGGELEFPGEETERSFADYVYFAVAMQATFAVTDVAARTRAMRRQLSLHTVVAFVFNTVILAVIVALLIGG